MKREEPKQATCLDFCCYSGGQCLESCIMQTGTSKNIVVGIFATIALEVLGAASWELAVKPGGSWFWHIILTSATFGSEAVKDSIYLEAAKENHEAVSLFAILVLSGFVGMAAAHLSGPFIFYRMRSQSKSHAVQLDGSIEKRLWIERSKPKILRYGPVTITILVLLMLGAFWVYLIKITAANELYTNFRQSLDICRPYITEHQAQVLKSRYAALRTREEYLAITDEMKKVADTNHLRLPDFKPW